VSSAFFIGKISRNFKMPVNKLQNADSGGQWWQIEEIYPHKDFYLGMARSLYLQFKALYDKFREVEIALDHVNPAYKENALRLIFGHAYLELIDALLCTIYLKTFLVFKIRKAKDSDSSHPVITTNIKRICPYCNSKRYGCLSDRFWELFSMSYQKPNGSLLHIKRCNRTKQLFIVEHPKEVLLVEDLDIKRLDKEVQITGKNGKILECPICHNKNFFLDESNLTPRWTRDMTPLLIYRKENINDIIDYQSYGEELQNQYANLDHLFSSLITTCEISYDNRPIYGPPFGINDMVPEQAGFDRPLNDHEKGFARSLKIQYYELKEVLRIANKVGRINFYKLQRKRIRNK
jgi:hypothetical protein